MIVKKIVFCTLWLMLCCVPAMAQTFQNLSVSLGLAATNAEVVIGPTNGQTAITADVTGTFSATLTPKVASLINGVPGTYSAVSFFNVVTGATTNTITAVGHYIVLYTAGSPFVKIQATTYASGSAVVTLNAGYGTAGGAGGGGGGGDASAANQATGNTSLANIDTNAGATTDAASSAGGTGTLSAKIRELSVQLATLATSANLAAGTTKTQIVASDGSTVVSAADEAVGAAVTNPPVGVGAIFETTPATIATGDRTALHTTPDQRLLVQNQGIGSSGSVPNENCDQQVKYDTNTNGKTQLVALASSKITRVCGVTITQSTATDVTVSLGSGTGTNCGTTYTAKTPGWVIAQNSVAQLNGISLVNSPIPYFATDASEELCVSTSAGVSVQILLSFSQR